MTLAESLFRQLGDPTLSGDERAQLRCRIAADLEHRGQYEAARDALGEWWQGVGEYPKLEGLSELIAGEVLLRVGTLSGWFGSTRQIEGAQEAAKDLISESITRFQVLGEITRVATAQSELGFCYYRAGAYDEARVMYSEALKLLGDSGEKEVRAKVLLRLVIVESCTGRHNDALRILTDSVELFEQSDNDALKGKFHNDLACVLVLLGKSERRADYTDRAIIEYTAASHHFGQAGHTGYRASAENNLGFLLYLVGRYDEAHKHLNHARILFLSVRDKGRIAQVDDVRARVLLAQSKTSEAERVIHDAVRTLEKGGEQALLAEALTTQGRVLAKLGNFVVSQSTLRRAADLAEQAGAVEDAGRALLTLIEDHSNLITERALLETYQRADTLLKDTQDAETVARLRECASRIVAARFAALTPRHRVSPTEFWENFDLLERIRAYEARYVRRALIDAEGSVTRASRLLGLTHHGTLSFMLKARHKDLAHLRTLPERRFRSILHGSSAARQPSAKSRPSRSQAVRILHVEDNKIVAAAVRDSLEDVGWRVATCADGAEAMKVLASDAPFNLVIFDYDLPDRNGIELIRYGRTLQHRRRTPFIMFSASNVEPEAWRAGADAFLRKPEDVGSLAATITRLLTKNTK
ncbi:MAG: ubiquitin-protein ligase [Acidobacteriota bacterium]|nr:ubiquitin-protein ligase [Acidobacteriota bacterium]